MGHDRVSHVAPARELSGYHVAGDGVDIRAWRVLADDAQPVGVVDRLMVETSTGKVRYACVSMRDFAAAASPAGPWRCVLVPIGLLRRLAGRRAVRLEGISRSMLQRAPRLRERPVTRGDENATLVAYGLSPARDLYDAPAFDERPLATADSD